MNHEEIYSEICKPSFASIEGKVDKILECINGNGTIGLKTRVDRLEQRSSLYMKIIVVLFTIVATRTVNDIFNHYNKFPIDKPSLCTVQYYPDSK